MPNFCGVKAFLARDSFLALHFCPQTLLLASSLSPRRLSPSFWHTGNLQVLHFSLFWLVAILMHQCEISVGRKGEFNKTQKNTK